MNQAELEQINNVASTGFSDPEIEQMLKAGVHLGHAKSKNNSSMGSYIFGVRNTISVIDLLKTKEKLAPALRFLKETALKGGMVLFVGTRPAARKIIPDIAEELGMPYFTERWIGGTLTNFKVISKRVEYMIELERALNSGELAKYTKWEQMQKAVELERLKRFFNGLRALKRLPDAVFVVDTTHDTTAVHEARKMKIPLVALVDTNADANKIDYPIPSNDDALSAVRYMIGRIGDAIREGKNEIRGEKESESTQV
ncbi:MAG: 30S ribosomal protein S2 [Candidatus Sungbacteria bacterium]|nr:30S ribosomal protein S2 [Candidatus Sungbacteria bacterium]